MITVKRLKALLELLPEDGRVHAYEGEDIGLTVALSNGTYAWIRARENDAEDDYIEGFPS